MSTLPPAATLPSNLQAVLAAAVAELVQQIVRGELAAALPRGESPEVRWVTPPAASRATRVPVKTIRTWVQAGRIRKRLKNRSPDPKQPKYLVNIDDVVAAAEAWAGSESQPNQVNDLKEQARQILAARAARGR